MKFHKELEKECGQYKPIVVDNVLIVGCRYEKARMWPESIDFIEERGENRRLMNSLVQNVWKVLVDKHDDEGSSSDSNSIER